MKIKVLIVTDSPQIQTGQGIVHREIGQGLYNLGYDVISLGWGKGKSLDLSMPWKIYSPESTKDYYGKNMFDAIISTERPDIVLTIGDTWAHSHIVKSRYRGLFQWVGYVAIDGVAFDGGIPETWKNVINDMDKIVAYTNYGRDAIGKSLPIEKDNIELIYHGIDLTKFYTKTDVEKTALRKKAGIPEDAIVYLFVARNQFRKNVPEVFKAWSKFTANGKHPNAMLFPHMVFNDPMGWNLFEVIDTCNIKSSVMYLTEFANSGSNIDVISYEQLNVLYNACDICLLMSGEGFGLPLFEAMACSKPIITINHSACQELVKSRGELVDVLTTITGVHTTERPIFSTDSLVEKLDLLYNNTELRTKYGKLGNEYVQNYTWEKMSLQWDKLLQKVMNSFADTCKVTVIS